MQLFEYMNNRGTKYTMDAFIETYIEAEQMLVSKIEKSKQNIQDFIHQKTEAEMKLRQVQMHEVLNEYGVMIGLYIISSDRQQCKCDGLGSGYEYGWVLGLTPMWNQGLEM